MNAEIERTKMAGEYKLERTRIAVEKKLEYEKLRHANIMEELKLMAKSKIKGSPRGGPIIFAKE